MEKLDHKGVKIARVNPAQVEALHNYCMETYPFYFKDYWEPAGLISYLEEQYSLRRLLGDINDPQYDYYFILNGQNPVGYLKLNYQPLLADKDRCVELEKIYLFPGENSQGFGSRALEQTEALARDLGKNYLVLYVLDTNQPGKSFYLRNGYHKIGTHRLNYQHFKPALRGLDLMCKAVI